MSETKTCEMIEVRGGAGFPDEEVVCGRGADWLYEGVACCTECAASLDSDSRATVRNLPGAEDCGACAEMIYTGGRWSAHTCWRKDDPGLEIRVYAADGTEIHPKTIEERKA